MISFSDFCNTARKVLPAEDIDFHESDLYLRKSKKSTELINQYEFRGQVTEFTDCIEHTLWYDVPFAYFPR